MKENSINNWEGMTQKTYPQPDAKEIEQFWTKIWQPKKNHEQAEWINDMTSELEGLEEGPREEIHIELLKKTLKKISNWKTPGHDGIYRFWFKKFTSIHDRLVLEMNRCLQDAQVPDCMTKGKTTLIQKNPSKGTDPNNYRPITCLPMMWKILTAQIREEIYCSLTSHRLFPDEQKGCLKGSRGIAELLYIDQHILNESKNSLQRPRLGFRRSATTLYPSLTSTSPPPTWTRWTTSFGHTSRTLPTWPPTTPKPAWSPPSAEYSPSSRRRLWKRHDPSSGSLSRRWLRLKSATLNRCQLYYIIKLPELIFSIKVLK